MPIPAAAMSPETWAMLMSMTGGGNQGEQKPWQQAGAQGLTSGIQGLAGYFEGAPQRKLFNQEMGRGTDLYDLFRWKSGYGKPVISPEMWQKFFARFRMAQRPMQTTLGANAARMGSMSSPDIQKMVMGQAIAPEAEYAGKLDMTNLNLTQDRDQALAQFMLRLAGR